MKRKRLIGLLLVVALLCTAMVVQLVSASAPDELRLNPQADTNLSFYDYYLKSLKVYKNDELRYTLTNNYIFHDDGTIDVKQFTRNTDGSSSTNDYSVQREYDNQDRLISFKSVSENDDFNKQYTFDHMENGSYVLNVNEDGFVLPQATYDPEFDCYLMENGSTGGVNSSYSFEYDKEGHKTKMVRTYPASPSYEVLFDYEKDKDTGKIIKKTYTIYEGEKDPVSGTVDISYSGEYTIHTETETDNISTVTYTRTFDKDNHLIEMKATETISADTSLSVISSCSYNDLGILVSTTSGFKFIYNGIVYQDDKLRYDYTYDYRKRSVPVIPENLKANKAYNGAQESLNEGDDINIEMTGAIANSIKTAGVKSYEGTDSEYYFNKINTQIDDTKDLELSMNITGSDVGEIDEEEPAPLRSIAIYDDKTFTDEHLVATGEEFISSVEVLDNHAAPVQAMIRGTLAITPKVAAANTDGYKLSVTVPEDKLEKDKTYYFVIGRDMVTNDLEAKSTNTDIVFEFTTGEIEDQECDHTAGEPVRENEVPATCTKEGSYDEVVYCTECEEEISREHKTVDKLQHKAAASVKENEVAATCTKEGSYDEVVYCSECGEELSRKHKTIEKIPHNAAAPVRENEVAATCAKEGSYDEVVYCTECEEELSRETKTIDKLPHNYENGSCTVCGAKDPDYKPDVNNDLDPSVNGIVQCPDGRWAMYKNGKVDTTCTTIAQNKYGWWRVENGYVNFDAQGIYQNKFGWWKTTNGKVTFKETGIFENENGTWRVENSKVNFAANGIYQGKDGWYKTTNGKVTFKENGIFQNQFGWWYVKNSKVDFDYTGIASNNYGKWYINKGKVDFTKVGFVKVDGKTCTVMFGKVIFG